MDDPLTKGLTDAGKLTLILGLVALLAGIWLGFFQTVSDDGVDCGTTFQGNSFVTAEELLGATPDCDGAMSSAKPLPIVLLLLGAGAAGGAYVLKKPSETEPTSPSAKHRLPFA